MAGEATTRKGMDPISSSFHQKYKKDTGTAPLGDGEFGLLTHSLDSMGDSPSACFSRSSPFSPFQPARIVMALHVFVFLLVVCLLLASFTALARFPGSLFGLPPQKAGPSAARSTVCGTASLPRRWPRLSSRLHGLVGCGASTCGCRAPGARSQAGGEHRSEDTPRASLVPTSSARPSGSPMPTFMRFFGDGKHGRAERMGDLSRPCVPYHVHGPAQHCPVPFENPFEPDRHGADGAGRRAGPFGCRTGRRAPDKRPSPPG
jgi:hypothetical protein